MTIIKTFSNYFLCIKAVSTSNYLYCNLCSFNSLLGNKDVANAWPSKFSIVRKVYSVHCTLIWQYEWSLCITQLHVHRHSFRVPPDPLGHVSLESTSEQNLIGKKVFHCRTLHADLVFADILTNPPVQNFSCLTKMPTGYRAQLKHFHTEITKSLKKNFFLQLDKQFSQHCMVLLELLWLKMRIL